MNIESTQRNTAEILTLQTGLSQFGLRPTDWDIIPQSNNLHVIKNADWIIDMGPEGGSKGGKVMFEGTPKELLKAKQSLTSAYLKD